MLAFLDAFCRALVARDRLAIRRHLRHPLARALPPAVRAEALAIARAGEHGHLPPTRTLHFYYQSMQLLASSEPPPDPPSAAGDPPLRARTPGIAVPR
ncbi:MAG TPA: hypothetical protein VFT41_03950 [Gemmatimonadaceae bacterium]|nr:hypothetical protein [Gemmatimonadaceae bacterium]